MAVRRRPRHRGAAPRLQGDVLTAAIDASAPTVYSVEAYSYASRFILKDIAACVLKGAPSAPAPVLRSTKTQLIVEWPHVTSPPTHATPNPQGSFVYAYDFGALVFVNVPETARKEILAAVFRTLLREPHPPLHEDFLVEVRAGGLGAGAPIVTRGVGAGAPIVTRGVGAGAPIVTASRVEVALAFDRVVVPELGPSTLEVVAMVLAQSVSIDYYDEDAQAILDRIAVMATEVARKGRPFGRQRELVRFAGSAMAFQAEIIGAILLLDKPDLTWEDEHADRLHDQLRYHFEIGERYKALETKLVTIRDTLQALLAMGSERRMFFVEVAVLVLIVIEVVMGFVRVH